MATLLVSMAGSAQKKFKVIVAPEDSLRMVYTLVDDNEKLIRKLDNTKYLISFNNEEYGYFAVFGVKGYKGWAAIDADENILFDVYNITTGEPIPDNLVEGKIRIKKNDDLIGYANAEGKIVITPQFELATTFYKGKAIIGKGCVTTPLSSEEHTGCRHYETHCKMYGYINKKGDILKIGKFSFEKVKKRIGWEPSWPMFE